MTEAEYLAAIDAQHLSTWALTVRTPRATERTLRLFLHAVIDASPGLKRFHAKSNYVQKTLAEIEAWAEKDAAPLGESWRRHRWLMTGQQLAEFAFHWRSGTEQGNLGDDIPVPLKVAIFKDMVPYHPYTPPPPHVLRYREGLVVRLAETAYTSRAKGEKCSSCEGRGKVYTSSRHYVKQDCLSCNGTGHTTAGHLCPDAVAILCDGLEEAGCEGSLLEHLRGTTDCPDCNGEEIWEDPQQRKSNCMKCSGTGRVAGKHYRGCAAIDCLLGRQQ